jgi:hypothetical protein
MSDQSLKKEIEKYSPGKSIQLNMFELLDSSLRDYSNSIELYDTMPKYHVGGIEREKGKLVESLPILTREFIHRSKPYKIDVSPAAVHDKKTGKTIHYYPSQREELVEDALRKIATKGKAKEFEKDGERKVGVTFSYYELQQELERMGHGYSIAEVKLAIEILSKATIEITSKDDSISMTNNFFSAVGKETEEKGGKERVLVIFHNLVSKAINTGNYRLFNYDKLMKMKMQVSRWLYKRISHIFIQATINNPYPIKLSTIVRDSGMKEYKTISERARQVEKCFDELAKKEIGVISKWEKFPEREKNKILDIKYHLYMSEDFVSDAKKASAITNERLDHKVIDATPYNVDDLRCEMEKPIYDLTKTVINSQLNNINSKEDYDRIANALEAAKEYIELKKSKGASVTNSATTKAALREGWKPKGTVIKQEEEHKELDRVVEENKKKKEQSDIREKLQDDPIWLKIQNGLRNSFAGEGWDKWLSRLELFSLTEKEIVLNAPDKFVRDWIIRELIDRSFIENGKTKNLKIVVQEICPKIEKVLIICVMPV